VWIGVVLAAVVLLIEVFWAGVLGVDALATGGVESDWARMDNEEPSKNRKRIAANASTARLRTQTLPTAESWHP
jgi:hypothetical protein